LKFTPAASQDLLETENKSCFVCQPSAELFGWRFFYLCPFIKQASLLYPSCRASPSGSHLKRSLFALDDAGLTATPTSKPTPTPSPYAPSPAPSVCQRVADIYGHIAGHLRQHLLLEGGSALGKIVTKKL